MIFVTVGTHEQPFNRLIKKMKKHAFLLQVHNNKSQLIKLLDYLDYPDNDIYIQIRHY